MFVFYDWPFPHEYFAKNVANTIFPFNSWLSFQRLCRVDKYITETFFSVDNKHRILFVINLSKGCKFTPKMHQNTFGGRTPPGPAGGACALPKPLAAMGVPTSKRREGLGQVLEFNVA